MNERTSSRPLSDPELQRLDELLGTVDPDDSMMLEELDGFLAALACSPEQVPQAEWLPSVLGTSPDVAETRIGEAALGELLELVTRHRASVMRQLYEGESFAPVIGVDDEGRALGDAWAIGFVRGMALRPDAWAALDEEDEWADVLEPLYRFASEADPEADEAAEPVADEERDELIDEMLRGVMDVYEFFREERERSLAPEPLRREAPKVGRNDPCPCGSGKKFKACCGRID